MCLSRQRELTTADDCSHFCDVPTTLGSSDINLLARAREGYASKNSRGSERPKVVAASDSDPGELCERPMLGVNSVIRRRAFERPKLQPKAAAV